MDGVGVESSIHSKSAVEASDGVGALIGEDNWIGCWFYPPITRYAAEMADFCQWMQMRNIDAIDEE